MPRWGNPLLLLAPNQSQVPRVFYGPWLQNLASTQITRSNPTHLTLEHRRPPCWQQLITPESGICGKFSANSQSGPSEEIEVEAGKQFAMNNDNWQKVKGKVKGAKWRKVAVENDKWMQVATLFFFEGEGKKGNMKAGRLIDWQRRRKSGKSF